MNKIVSVAAFAILGFCVSTAQEHQPAGSPPDSSNSSMPGMDMSSHDMSHTSNEGTASAMHAMEGRHMDMGPHMKMTPLRPVQPGDTEKAAQVVAAARKVSEKYADYKVALADGFKIFHPELPQKQYHFTNYEYAFEAGMNFNPDHPTSLLYEKTGDGYKLIGVMYTAPKGTPEDELNSRVPLSIAHWHAHINLCIAPPDKRGEAMGPRPQFGLGGSIATKDACDAAGGRFMPQIFGWMVHVYPFEQKQEDIWSVEKQMSGHME